MDGRADIRHRAQSLTLHYSYDSSLESQYGGAVLEGDKSTERPSCDVMGFRGQRISGYDSIEIQALRSSAYL